MLTVLLAGAKVLGLGRNCFLKTENNITIETDDGLEYCASERLVVIFFPGEHPSNRKTWPDLYILPPINSVIDLQIRSCTTRDEATTLKLNTVFCSSFLEPILDDVCSYLDDSK